jgi:isocitrate dehydrogenase kinase/phosphatase
LSTAPAPQSTAAGTRAGAGAVSMAFSSALRAGQCAQRIVEGFLAYNAAFRAVTRRAPLRFRDRDWQGSQADAVERIDLYDRYVQQTISDLERSIGAVTHEAAFWPDAKRHFANLIEGLPDSEFCKTYFSSVTRRIFRTVGVAPEIEFVATDLDPLARAGTQLPLRLCRNTASLPALADELLQQIVLPAAWPNRADGARELASELQQQLGAREIVAVEVIDELFYHFTRAYVVGRVIGLDFELPLALVLKHDEQGVALEGVMLSTAELATLFGYARSYLHVDLEHVADAVLYLRQLLPRAPVGELFTVLGRAKQGKTERHRSLMHHLRHSDDQFEVAPGQRGLVMICFTLPSLDVVFKVIRDHIPVQKNLSRSEVQARYNFVFKHDRAGRLVDAQEFRRTRFPRARFSPALLAELQAEAGESVHCEDEYLVFEHLYMERRVTPLDLYLKSAPLPQATEAALDYGSALRDLAHTNIFAGDLLAKNFGVTQYGRVVFYDYDEVAELQNCRFRELPVARHHEEEMSAEPWFAVDDADVFPETFGAFLPFYGAQRQAFMAEHGELLQARYWQNVQRQLASGAVLELSRVLRRATACPSG